MKPFNRKSALERISRDIRNVERDQRECVVNFDAAAKIIQSVCRYYGLTIRDLQNGGRLVAWPRQLAMYLLKERTSYPISIIALLFKKHSGTVLNALTTVQNRLDTEEKIRLEVDVILAGLQC